MSGANKRIRKLAAPTREEVEIADLRAQLQQAHTQWETANAHAKGEGQCFTSGPQCIGCQLRQAQETIEGMRRDGCAAVGLVQNIFNGLTAEGVPTEPTIREMAGACARLLSEVSQCNHKTKRDAAIKRRERLWQLYRNTLERVRRQKQRAEAAEALLKEVAGALQYDGKTLTVYDSLPDILRRIPAEAQARQKEDSDD